MCGISCIINKKALKVQAQNIQLMNDCVEHRGPDGDGIYTYNNMALGHRRLSVIDLSNAGAQPMAWNDQLVITFNGEIYNYLEIKKELETKGYQFKSKTDTEVILAAYHYWGKDCLYQFNGMWAFVILDKRTNTVFCSRDRFGVKPFYYVNNSAGFYVGSEIKQVLPFVERRNVCKAVLADYLLLNMSDHTTDTFFDEVKNLRGGHYLIYELSNNNFVINKWYSPVYNETINGLSEDDALELFQSTFENSVKLRLRSDVKVGTCLSGGLDSSYIAAIAAENYKSNNSFSAVTAQSTDKVNDETAYAKLLADKYNLNWNITTPQPHDFINVLDDVINIQEEPFADLSVYMQYFVMQKAKAAGIVVLLDGQGADESLLGYQRHFLNYYNNQSLFTKPFLIKNMMDKYGMSLKSIIKNIAYFNNPSLRYKIQKAKYAGLNTDIINACRTEYLYQYKNINKTDGLRQLQLTEMFEHSLPQLLRFEDKNSMHFSIETRLPFLDWQLIELVYSINDSLKFKKGWSKYILRKSVEKVAPAQIAWRKRKIGFAAPTASWLNNKSLFIKEIKNSEFLIQIFNKKLPDFNNNYVLWKLFCLNKWANSNKVYI